jgi:type II secretory pathway pseudopilin PulG
MDGHAMVSLLVGLGIMSILLSILLPVWNQSAKRDREFELVFRGEQYARAIELYQRRFAGAYPPDFNTLVEQKLLRRMYSDPMTYDGEFRIIYLSQIETFLRENSSNEASEGSREGGAPEPIRIEAVRFDNDESGGVVGVVSESDNSSLRVYNGRQKYNEWAFIYAPSSRRLAEDTASIGSAAPRTENRDRSVFSDRR